MRIVALLCVLPLLACAKQEQQPPATSAVPSAMAGTWRVASFNEKGDSIEGYRLVATADTSGWSVGFPNRDPIPARVVGGAGDSVTVDAGPYESALRPGVRVHTRTAYRLRGDTLHGQTVARYTVMGPDSLLNIHSVGTRVP